MGLREIPNLSILCLRAIVSRDCNTEKTFAPTKDGQPSTASRLLRSFHNRPVLRPNEKINDFLIDAQKSIDEIINKDDNNENDNDNDNEKTTTNVIPTIELIPMKRTPAIGNGSGRRKQANDVDLNHPWIGIYQPEFDHSKKKNFLINKGMMEDDVEDDDEHEHEQEQEQVQEQDNIPTDPESQVIVAEYGSCAIDLLQSYVDSLVELGRMDDNRLGLFFFKELKVNIELQYQVKKYTQRGLLLLENGGGNGGNDGNGGNGEGIDSFVDDDAAVDADVTAAAPPVADVMNSPIPKKKKRKRSGGGATTAAQVALKKKEAAKRAEDEMKRQAAILAAVPKRYVHNQQHVIYMLTSLFFFPENYSSRISHSPFLPLLPPMST